MCSVGTAWQSGGTDLVFPGRGEGVVPGQGAALPHAWSGVVASSGRDGQARLCPSAATSASAALSPAGPPCCPRCPTLCHTGTFVPTRESILTDGYDLSLTFPMAVFWSGAVQVTRGL